MPAEKREVDMFKSKAPEKDQDAAANLVEAVGRAVQQQPPAVEQPPARPGPTTNAMVQRRSSVESKGSCTPLIFSSATAHKSREASLRRTLQSAAGSRAPFVPSASSCRTVVRSRVTSFIGRYRSTRTLCLKDRHGELKIQRTNRQSAPKARRKKACRARPWPRICTALNHRHPLTGPSPPLSRGISVRSSS